MNKIAKLLTGLTLLCVSAVAQDAHYSQFFYSPLTVNPANTGLFNGDFRAYTMYRMQWFTVPAPYKTFSLALDAPVFKNKMNGEDFFSLGLDVNNDNQGAVKLKTNSYNLLMSYTKYLGGGPFHNDITLGYEVGYNIRSAGLGALKWDSQYDPNTGGYNPYGLSGEQGGSAVGYLDMSTGAVWNFNTNHLFRSAVGFSVHHFTRPNISLIGGSDKLLPQYSFQWNVSYRTDETSNTFLEPALLVAKQGNSLLINGGISAKYLLQERSRYTHNQADKAIHIGAFYRYGDALFLTFRMDYLDFSGAIAYDINISGLTPATSSVGGFELMLQYKTVFGKNKISKRTSTRFM